MKSLTQLEIELCCQDASRFRCSHRRMMAEMLGGLLNKLQYSNDIPRKE